MNNQINGKEKKVLPYSTLLANGNHCKEPSVEAESSEVKWDKEQEIYIISRWLATHYLLISKGKIVTWECGNFNQVIRVKNHQNREKAASQYTVLRRTQHHFRVIPAQNAEPEGNDEKTYKLKWRDILQNNWSVLFREVKIIEDRKRWGTLILDQRRLKWQHHAVGDPGMEKKKRKAIKDTIGTINKICLWIRDEITVLFQYWISWFWERYYSYVKESLSP